MKFVARDEPAKKLFDALDSYLNWKKSHAGESGKNIKFITVVGTSGIGKTTFARRFIDLPYIGKYFDIVEDCKNSNRRYRLDCSDFVLSRDPETQLSLLILLEAFKYSVPVQNYDLLLSSFFDTSPNCRVSFQMTLKFITETFWFDSSNIERLVVINLDETNALLGSDEAKQYLQRLLKILYLASKSFNLISILSGTHSVALFDFIDISGCKFLDIELSLIELESSKEIILGMKNNSNESESTRGSSSTVLTTASGDLYVSPYLEYLLTLCGGIGRYLEITIIQMSIMGGAKYGFRQDCYNYFMDHMQTSQNIETLLDKVTTAVLAHYPKVFLKFTSYIELLTCYTLFQWSVRRDTLINDKPVSYLEKEGFVFLQPIPNAPDWYLCVIPFITLYWALKFSTDSIKIPLLKKLDSYSSSDESENNSLHIIMAKLSALVKKKGLTPDSSGRCTVLLSDLFPLRHRQPDIEIKFWNSFEIQNAGQQINLLNYKKFKHKSKCFAYLNAKSAPFADAVIFSDPIIGIQEKQSVVAKQQQLRGLTVPKFNDKAFQEERKKFPADGIFVLISDGKQGDIVLGDRDIFLDFANFEKLAGPLIALRKLYCINEFNPKVKRMKMD